MRNEKLITKNNEKWKMKNDKWKLKMKNSSVIMKYCNKWIKIDETELY